MTLTGAISIHANHYKNPTLFIEHAIDRSKSLYMTDSTDFKIIIFGCNVTNRHDEE